MQPQNRYYRSLFIVSLLVFSLSAFIGPPPRAAAAPQAWSTRPSQNPGSSATPPVSTPESPTPTPTLEPPTGTPTDVPPTVTPTDVLPTETPVTATPTVPTGFFRPVVVVASYKPKPRDLKPGSNFELELDLANQGQVPAVNVLVLFSAGDFSPRKTGGVMVIGELKPGETRRLNQAMVVSPALQGVSSAATEVRVSYTDENGVGFNDTFSLGLNLSQPKPTPGNSGSAPTPTPTAGSQPLLVISTSSTDVEPLQPGTRFLLEVEVTNMGNSDARRVTMVSGGATVQTSDPETPNKPGDVSASGGEFTNFSPLGSSNIQSLGDIPAGGKVIARQQLIVNVSTNPGAYAFKVSFVYFDEKENRIIDDQVITLLVYAVPVVDVSFYRDPGPMFAGQPNQLPIQIVNLGKKSVVLGNMRVTAADAEVLNNTVLVGTLDAGGYFTLDATLIPSAPGLHEILVTVDYTDDFNEPKTITKQISVDVHEAPEGEPGVDPQDVSGEGPGTNRPGAQPESMLQLALRFVRGMIGLDSGQPMRSVVLDAPPVESGPERYPAPAGIGPAG